MSAGWEQKEEWASGWVESATGGRSAVVFLWAFTILWNTVSWLAMIATLQGRATGNTELAPIFPAIGLALLAFAIYITLHHRRWGGSRLELLTRPGVLGGPLRCVLHAPPALARAESLHVSLDCVGARPGSGFELYRHLWHHEASVPAARFETDGECRVALDFVLPYDLPESDLHRSPDEATWRLRVSADVRGVDFEAVFPLPVFRTVESVPGEGGSRAELPPEAPDLRAPPGPGWAPVLPGSKIRVRPFGSGGREVRFGMLRNKAMGVFQALFTAFFAGAVAFLVWADGPAFFVTGFGLATALLAWSTIDTLFAVTRVRATRGLVEVTHGPFGIGPTRRASLHEIERIAVVPQVQYGRRTYSWIHVIRATRPGERRRLWEWRRRIMAGSRIPTAAEARTLVELLRESVGL